MHKILTAALAVILMSSTAFADSGLIIKTSAFDVATTLDRLEAVIKKKGITIFARIDHAAGAQKIGATLAPTQLLVFGNPKLGTPMMQSSQVIGIDLPLKVLAWQGADGKVRIAYNDPAHLAKRHGIADRDAVVKKMSGALNKLTDVATKP
jgi:uncharacterized protein (DUF302 family)